MKKKIVFISIISFASICFFNLAYADTAIHLDIKTPAVSIYDQDITVTPCDSDNNPETPDTITAYCAVLQSGFPSIWDWSWPPGAFLTSINNISGYTSKDKDNNDVYHYWSWSLNSNEAITGLNEYELQPNDLILLNFIDPADPADPIPGGDIPSLAVFSIEKAINFLSSNQKTDGSFGDMLYTDWVAISVGASGNVSFSMSLKNFLQNNIFDSSVVTDNERHALALMTLNINPYTGTSINYIKKINDSFDGTQIGDASLINDDIFGLIVLSKAGYSPNDEIISKDINYILTKQGNDGSWGGNVDMTSAGIQALHQYANIISVANAIIKAKNYLTQNQNQIDGGFGNNFSTSWALQALSLDSSLSIYISKADSYLAWKQQIDGGIEDLTSDISNRIWSTSYAIPAVLHKSFGDSIQSFTKYISPVSVSSSVDGVATTIKNESPVITHPIIPVSIKEVLTDNKVANKKELSKIEIPKNKNIINKPKTKVVISTLKTSTNNLVASAESASVSHSVSYTVINIITSAISAPFKWLWVHLGF
jgi:hypothetical protein